LGTGVGAVSDTAVAVANPSEKIEKSDETIAKKKKEKEKLKRFGVGKKKNEKKNCNVMFVGGMRTVDWLWVMYKMHKHEWIVCCLLFLSCLSKPLEEKKLNPRGKKKNSGPEKISFILWQPRPCRRSGSTRRRRSAGA
jgi:hypothetical protein